MAMERYIFSKDKVIARERFLDRNLYSKDKRYIIQLENYDNEEIIITILEMNINDGTQKPLAFWHGSPEACSLFAHKLNEMVDTVIRTRYEKGLHLP